MALSGPGGAAPSGLFDGFDEGFLAATNELMSLHVSLETRRAGPMSADVLARLADVLSVHETLPVPPQVGRRIGLDAGSSTTG